MDAFKKLVIYQVGWFACVLGAAWDRQGIGVTIALCSLGTHLWLSNDRQSQIRLIVAAAAIGFVVDTAQLWAGIYKFPHGTLLESFPPPFMTVLWMQFATTFRYSMSWLSKRYVLCAMLGLLGAPLAFLAGEQLGAIVFLSPRVTHLRTGDDFLPGYRGKPVARSPLDET